MERKTLRLKMIDGAPLSIGECTAITNKGLQSVAHAVGVYGAKRRQRKD